MDDRIGRLVDRCIEDWPVGTRRPSLFGLAVAYFVELGDTEAVLQLLGHYTYGEACAVLDAEAVTQEEAAQINDLAQTKLALINMVSP